MWELWQDSGFHHSPASFSPCLGSVFFCNGIILRLTQLGEKDELCHAHYDCTVGNTEKFSQCPGKSSYQSARSRCPLLGCATEHCERDVVDSSHPSSIRTMRMSRVATVMKTSQPGNAEGRTGKGNATLNSWQEPFPLLQLFLACLSQWLRSPRGLG